MRDLVVTGQGARAVENGSAAEGADRSGSADKGGRPLLRTLVGAVLRRTRLEQRRTLAEVAKTAKVSMQYLSELERGRKEASSEVLAAVCDALRIDLPDLLAEVGRDLAAARQRHPAILRIGFGPDDPAGPSQQAPAGQLGLPRRPRSGEIVGLVAA
jgi:transcriptional regulator with XRE-family HTH domain